MYNTLIISVIMLCYFQKSFFKALFYKMSMASP